MNDELHRLYDGDLWEHRQGYTSGSPEYRALRDRDRQRRAGAEELIESHALTAPEDYFHAARLFQHGDTAEDAWRAHVLARTSAELGYAQARWLAAAAYDHWLMYQGKPQKYGTKYVSDGKRQRLWDVDPATSAADRAAWDVPPLAEQLRNADEATRNHPRSPSTSTKHRSGSERHCGAGNRKSANAGRVAALSAVGKAGRGDQEVERCIHITGVQSSDYVTVSSPTRRISRC